MAPIKFQAGPQLMTGQAVLRDRRALMHGYRCEGRLMVPSGGGHAHYDRVMIYVPALASKLANVAQWLQDFARMPG